MSKKRVHLYIFGRVQGVYFRQTALKISAEIGKIYGWIRNTSCGRVEAVIEGDEIKVDKMIEWCKKGPSSANVTKIEILEEKYENEFSDFRVKYTL